MKTLALVAAILLTVQFRSAAATTNEIDLKQLARQYVPGCALQPDSAPKPTRLVSAGGDVLDLAAAARENSEPRKGVAYWVTPTMAFLSRQGIQAGTTNDAVGVIELLNLISRGSNFVKQKTYRAFPFEGGWGVEVDQDFTNPPGIVLAVPPYELLLDGSRRVTQIRERSFPYAGSARVSGNAVRSVYERQLRPNGRLNYSALVKKELAKAWAAEKAQKPVKPAPAPKK